jgi:hypothetical protein
MSIVMSMNEIIMPIGKGRAILCELSETVQTGVNVVFTSHGKPKAVLSAYRPAGRRWRVSVPDDLARYGDLQSPVLEAWP